MYRNLVSAFLLSLLFGSGLAFSKEEAAPRVILETSLGQMEIELFPDKAPLSVENFLTYVNDGFYDGTIFHRVIQDFMIQGGGFTSDMKKKPARPAIGNEADNGLRNEMFTLALARTNDPHSATSQFFINVAKNRSLDHRDQSVQGWGYTVFGQVTEGREVVKEIARVKTTALGRMQDVPREPVVIERAYVKQD